MLDAKFLSVRKTSNLHGTKKTKSSLLISSPQNTELHPQWRRFPLGMMHHVNSWCHADIINFKHSFIYWWLIHHIIQSKFIQSIKFQPLFFHASNLRFLSHYLWFFTRTVRWRPQFAVAWHQSSRSTQPRRSPLAELGMVWCRELYDQPRMASLFSITSTRNCRKHFKSPRKYISRMAEWCKIPNVLPSSMLPRMGYEGCHSYISRRSLNVETWTDDIWMSECSISEQFEETELEIY